MVTHLCAYYTSNVGTSETVLSAVQDDILTRSTDERFLVPSDRPFVRWAWAWNVNLVRARLVSASLETRRHQGLLSYGYTFSLGSQQRNYAELFSRPLRLSPTEELEARMIASSEGQPGYVLVEFAPETIPEPPAGDVIRIRCVGNTTLRPNEWTTVRVVPEVSFEAGTYALINFYPASAGCVACRALISGQAYRPGVIGIAGGTDNAIYSRPVTDSVVFKPYHMGLFTHITPPQFQFLSISADTYEVVYIDVVKVA